MWKLLCNSSTQLSIYCPLCFQEDRYWITEVRLAALTQTLKLDCRLVSFRTGPEVFKRLLASFLTRVKYLVLKRATAVPNLKDARWHPRNWVVSYYLFLSHLWKLVASIWDFYIFSIYWVKSLGQVGAVNTSPKPLPNWKQSVHILNMELPRVALWTFHRLGSFDPLDPLGIHVVIHKSCFSSLR